MSSLKASRCPSIKLLVPSGPKTLSGVDLDPPAGNHELNQKSAKPTV